MKHSTKKETVIVNNTVVSSEGEITVSQREF
jgi:hypothetical protein